MTYHDTISADIEAVCYHCGLPVKHDGLTYDGKAFCCVGCKTVYDILNQNDLCTYYSLGAALTVQSQETRERKLMVLLPRDEIRTMSTPITISVLNGEKQVDVIETSFLGPARKK